jgi:hypothetical protein
VHVRLATKDDFDAIHDFWWRLENTEGEFKCAGPRRLPGNHTLWAWLTGDQRLDKQERRVAVVEEDGEIVLTEVFDVKTAQSYFTHTSNARFHEAVPLMFAHTTEWCGTPAWGNCHYPPSEILFKEIGCTVEDGVITWT